jgi:hypothetical protein
MRHVVHGLDADLIMLALATHEPHFCILRELVLDKRKQKAKEEAGDKGPTPFCLCKIWVLREYLHKEFVTANWNMVPGGYDLEKVIDDFVFMCFFVGNDFLPHLPAIEIRDGAIDMLIYAYKMLLPKLQARRTRRTPHAPCRTLLLALALTFRPMLAPLPSPPRLNPFSPPPSPPYPSPRSPPPPPPPPPPTPTRAT